MSRRLIALLWIGLLLASTALQASRAADALAETLDETSRAGAIEPSAAPMIGPTQHCKAESPGFSSQLFSPDLFAWANQSVRVDSASVRLHPTEAGPFSFFGFKPVYLLKQSFRC